MTTVGSNSPVDLVVGQVYVIINYILPVSTVTSVIHALLLK